MCKLSYAQLHFMTPSLIATFAYLHSKLGTSSNVSKRYPHSSLFSTVKCQPKQLAAYHTGDALADCTSIAHSDETMSAWLAAQKICASGELHSKACSCCCHHNKKAKWRRDSPKFRLGGKKNKKSSVRQITLPQHHTNCIAKVAKTVASFSSTAINSRKKS